MLSLRLLMSLNVFELLRTHARRQFANCKANCRLSKSKPFNIHWYTSIRKQTTLRTLLYTHHCSNLHSEHATFGAASIQRCSSRAQIGASRSFAARRAYARRSACGWRPVRRARFDCNRSTRSRHRIARRRRSATVGDSTARL